MKVAALLLLSFLALANASLNTCRCGMFITVGTVEYEVHELPPVENVDCDDKSICKKTCRAERGTGGAEVRVLQVPPGGRTTRGRATQPQTPTSPSVQTSRSPARFSSALCLAPPPLAALLSQHHSHFLASPVGYLYERGDR